MTDEMHNGDGHQEEIIMDLPDFIPQEFELSFKINNNEYVFNFMEASVDDILRMMLEKNETQEDHITRQRKTCLKFLQKNISVGLPDQLEKDLELVPYVNDEDKLSIKLILDYIQQRTKKKEYGAKWPLNLQSLQSGLLDK